MVLLRVIAVIIIMITNGTCLGRGTVANLNGTQFAFLSKPNYN